MFGDSEMNAGNVICIFAVVSLFLLAGRAHNPPTDLTAYLKTKDRLGDLFQATQSIFFTCLVYNSHYLMAPFAGGISHCNRLIKRYLRRILHPAARCF